MKKLFWSYSTILVLLAVLPINGSESVINNTYFVEIRLDYLIHFAVYLPWMFLLRLFTGFTFKNNLPGTMFMIFVGLVFALSNEFVQYLLPYRAFNINDLLANCMGIVMGAVVFFIPKPVTPSEQ